MTQPRSRRAPLGRTTRRAAATAALVLALLLAVGCRPPADRAGSSGPDDARRVEARVLGDVARIGPATIEVVVVDGGAAVDGATVRVTGDMTHAGMVPEVDDAVRAGPGIYRTRSFAFSMAGDWVLTVDVVYPDGARRQHAVPVAVGP